MRVLRNVFCGEIINSKIENDVEQHREIQQGKVNPVTVCPNLILNRRVNSKYSNRFHQKIEAKLEPAE